LAAHDAKAYVLERIRKRRKTMMCSLIMETRAASVVGTASTTRRDGNSVEKRSAPVNSSASSHTGGMWPGTPATMASLLAFEEETRGTADRPLVVDAPSTDLSILGPLVNSAPRPPSASTRVDTDMGATPLVPVVCPFANCPMDAVAAEEVKAAPVVCHGVAMPPC